MRFLGHHPMLARFVSADSYGLILLLVVVTYLLAVSLPTDGGQSVVLAIQIATVWLTLHTAKAPRSVRVVASVAFIGVAALAVVDVFVVVSWQTIAVGFAVSGLLYLLAPILVVRDIASHRRVDEDRARRNRRLSVGRDVLRLCLSGDRHPAANTILRLIR